VTGLPDRALTFLPAGDAGRGRRFPAVGGAGNEQDRDWHDKQDCSRFTRKSSFPSFVVQLYAERSASVNLAGAAGATTNESLMPSTKDT
jgi:hypothetical protein